MSHKNHNRNYTPYSKPEQVKQTEQPVKTNEEAVVTPVNEEVVEETVVAPAEPEPVYGVVSECARLNVRKEPNMDADIVTVLTLATEVLVDESNSTEDFYKIVTGTGVEGYCMKKFINLD